MVRFLLGFIYCLIYTGVTAQLTYAPEVVDIRGNPDENIIITEIVLTNTSEDSIDFYWRLERDNDFPPEWQTQFCDFNLCYAEGIDEISPDLPNVLEGEASGKIGVYILPNGMAGESGLTVKLYRDKELSSEILEINTNSIIISSSTSVQDINPEDLILYPNPTDHYFQVSNDRNVKTIVMYTIVGKEIRRFDHQPGGSHNIESLNKGIYLVRLFDDKGKALRSLRLSKR